MTLTVLRAVTSTGLQVIREGRVYRVKDRAGQYLRPDGSFAKGRQGARWWTSYPAVKAWAEREGIGE